MSEQAQRIVKIQSALSNKPTYVRVDGDMSIDRIFNEAIMNLRNSGMALDANSLEQLYKSHQIFANNLVVDKGQLFSELPTERQMVGDQTIDVLELNLVTSHAGG